MRRILNRLNVVLLRRKNKRMKIGERVRIDYKSKFLLYGNPLEIGNNVVIRSITKGYHAAMAFPTTFLIDVKDSYIKIGSNSRLNGVYIHAQKGITIGENCVIASGVNILDSNGHEVHSINRTIGRDLPEEIILGDNVWIGLNAIVLKGTSIGNNSIIGAASVVKGTFPDNSIIVGNPAMIVGKVKI